MIHDLRYFLQALQEKAPELFLSVKDEVGTKWELSSVQKKLELENRLPVLLFEKIRGYSMKVVTNLFASKRHFALALDTTPENVTNRFLEAYNNRIKPREVSDGPVKEVVLKGDKADLRTLPIVWHCEKDAGPYVTAGAMVVRDPFTNWHNVGIYRNRLISSKRLTANFAPLSHASQIAAKAQEAARELEAAIVLGHHPALAICSQYVGETGESELEVMGGLLSEPVDTVRCETVDVMVPADAEIVIEGKIRPGVRDSDGPFGDHWLYYAREASAPVFEVTAITHRENPIYHDIFNVGPEHVLLLSLGIEALALKHLKQLIPQVKAVNVPVSGVGNLVYVQIKKDHEGLGVNAVLAALGVYRFKCAVAVDEDVDIYDDRKVLWAIMTRTQADHSFFIVPGSYVSRVDPTGYPWHQMTNVGGNLTTRLGIDATKPLDTHFPEVANPPRGMWAQPNQSV
jgi:2,5-furandicarboxylate decarboxylase 1